MQCRSFQNLVLERGVHIGVHNSHSFCILTASSNTTIPNRFTKRYREFYCHTATSVMSQPHVLQTVYIPVTYLRHSSFPFLWTGSRERWLWITRITVAPTKRAMTSVLTIHNINFSNWPINLSKLLHENFTNFELDSSVICYSFNLHLFPQNNQPYQNIYLSQTVKIRYAQL